MAGPIQVSGELSTGQLENGKWVANDKDILVRLLCLGSRSETYNKIDWTGDMINILCVERLISAGREMEILDTIKEMSLKRRVPKMDVLISVYAYLVTQREDLSVKRDALDAILDICKIPPHLFLFIHYSEKIAKFAKESTGWGRGKRKAVAKWYNQFADDPQKLAMYVTKYQKRHHWSHVDVLRLSHLKPANEAIEVILNYIMRGLANTRERFPQENKILDYFQAVEDIKRASNGNTGFEFYVDLITKHKLLREHIPPQTGLLNRGDIWMALLPDMPIQAMLKNLTKLGGLGMLHSGSKGSDMVCNRLINVTGNGQIHPFNILVARKAYGQSVPPPNPDIINALDNAFTKAFQGVEETGYRFCVAVYLDPSMKEKINKCSILSAIEAAVAMVLTTVNTESFCDVLALGDRVTPINIPRNDPLQNVMQRFSEQKAGQSNCSNLLKWAVMNNRIYDVFIVYTSCSDTISGYPAAKALAVYRIKMKNPNTKFIVCSMTTKDYTVADPEDLGMLNIAGFDASTPDIIRNFVTCLQRN